ncbi:hypothetical protein [Desulfosporosinus metallidurans]|uniref:Uncharacterized protein n=1 Tax=Desulfosporosinus metallidurans TaxID=1888891 RepID=A0A1Q8QME2_9FIRM|nr:hypothetical protein [Desulfosporosinus metallidurans]OLN28513.1 hypothetical protein DSOL_4026 [Desulfosporosinus metallidurans]
MILSQSSFIPLYFDDDEADLWQALQRIEPEKRSSFIKETLRQGLLRTLPKDTLKVDSVHDPEETHDDAVEEKFKEIETFSLEALFSEAHVPEQSDNLLMKANPLPSAGYEYMMTHVIGTEDDESILKLLRGGEKS